MVPTLPPPVRLPRIHQQRRWWWRLAKRAPLVAHARQPLGPRGGPAPARDRRRRVGVRLRRRRPRGDGFLVVGGRRLAAATSMTAETDVQLPTTAAAALPLRETGRAGVRSGK